MSRNSLRFNLNQRKYNIKFIIYIFILLDVLLYFSFTWEEFLNLLGWEVSILIGLILGFRGSARLKDAVLELVAIRKDPKYDKDEALRGHMIEMLMDQICLEYDIWFQEKRGKKKVNNIKIQIKGEKRVLWDDVVKKQVGYSLIAIWELAVPLVYTLLEGLNWNWALVILLTGTWAIVGAFVWFYLHYIFGIEPEGEPPMAPVGEPMNEEVIKPNPALKMSPEKG